MKKGVRLVVVCEDLLHEVFARAFLYRRGFSRHDLQFEKAPVGRGDAKQCVRERLPIEIEAMRKFRGASRGVLCITDADSSTTHARIQSLDECCHSSGIAPRSENEPVFYFVPRWEIENWLEYLRNDACDEDFNGYDKFRNREADVYPLVEKLADMCAARRLSGTPPASLIAACPEHDRLKDWAG